MAVCTVHCVCVCVCVCVCLTLADPPAQVSDDEQQERRHGQEDPRPQEPPRDPLQERSRRGHALLGSGSGL